jgi:hypothetical protein
MDIGTTEKYRGRVSKIPDNNLLRKLRPFVQEVTFWASVKNEKMKGRRTG